MVNQIECIFCRIIRGEMPAAKVFEDEKTLAFLDINPVNPGHILVVPKTHSENLLYAQEDDAFAVIRTVRKVAPAMLAATGATAWNIGVNTGREAGQLVPHTHLHVIPRHKGDGLRHWPGHSYKEGEIEKMADKIRSHLS